MAQPYDLVTLDDATSYLAASLPPDVSALPFAISSASRSIRRWLKRDIVRTTYDELYNGSGFTKLILRQYPVNQVTKISVTPTTVLTVCNTDTTTNQEASAWLATSGDVASGLTVTGVQVARTASGVISGDGSPILFADCLTIGQAAAAINALGNSWKTTVTQGYANWATADLRFVQGAQAALGSGTVGAQFQLHAQPLAGFSVDELRGLVVMNTQPFDPAFAMQSIVGNGSLYPSVFPPGQLNIRVKYDAGYDQVPEDIQQATMMTVQAMLYDLQTVHVFDEEKIKDWTGKLATVERSGVPKAAQRLLESGGHRSYRRF